MIYQDYRNFQGEWRWKNFSPKELACGGGDCPYCEGEYYHDPYSLDMIQEARDELGIPFILNSAHRCAKRNTLAGSTEKSQHRKIAFDIRNGALSPEELYDFFDESFTETAGVGIYSWGVHVDFRPNKARW